MANKLRLQAGIAQILGPFMAADGFKGKLRAQSEVQLCKRFGAEERETDDKGSM